MSDVPQPVLTNSDEFKANYGKINWKKSYKRAPKKVKQDNTPVKGIPCIRSDKPHESKNAGIHADQVKSFNNECVRGVHYNAKGNMISTSSAAREREARRRGMSFG